MKQKHSIWIRITHWLNFPLLTVMIWSGALIYWANRAYWPELPDSFYRAVGINNRLAEGMSYHFAFMWLFALNALVYIVYLFVSGHWRELFPERKSFREALQVVAHDFGLRKDLPPQGKFNAAQRIAYTLVLLMGVGAIISGISIYKPVQMHWLKDLAGGFSFAHLLHYVIAIGFVLFFFVHVAQVVRAGWRNFAAMISGAEVSSPRKSAVSFAVFVAFIGMSVVGWQSLRHAEKDDGTRWPLRRVLQFNEKIWSAYVGIDRVDVINKRVPLGKKARVNGDLGLKTPVDVGSWSLQVETPPRQAGLVPEIITIKMDDLKAMGKTEITSELRCVEGWNEVMSFGGVPFREFIRRYKLGTRSGEAPDWENNLDDLFTYVGLATPDGEYYVSNDMKSMLNPHTILAYEQNGVPFSNEHGAPLRLYIPNKYGVKSLKRVGKIVFSDKPLKDFWGYRGYDWFLGL